MDGFKLQDPPRPPESGSAMVGKTSGGGWLREGWLRRLGCRAGPSHHGHTWAVHRDPHSLLLTPDPVLSWQRRVCSLSLAVRLPGRESFAQAAAVYLLTMEPVGAAPPAPFPALCGCVLFTQR